MLNRIADRRAGLTISRSIKPIRLSSMTPKPTKPAVKIVSITNRPGTNVRSIPPFGKPGAPPNPFSRGINRSRYSTGSNNPTRIHTGERRLFLKCRTKSSANCLSILPTHLRRRAASAPSSAGKRHRETDVQNLWLSQQSAGHQASGLWPGGLFRHARCTDAICHP